MAAATCGRLMYFSGARDSARLCPCSSFRLEFTTVSRDDRLVLTSRRRRKPVELTRASVAEGPSTSTSTLVTQDINFSWKGQATEVLLTGDFLGWQKKVPLEKSPDGTFQIKQKLSPGSYKYKFIVDGEWMHSPDCPTADDGSGGLNNEVIVKESVSSPPTGTASSEEPKQQPVAKPKPAAKKPPPKKVAKPYPDVMIEDVVPQLTTALQKEEDVTDVQIIFENDQMSGTFLKNGAPYSFWAYFPDGSLEGARGFSVSAYGSPASTIEPFLIDEKKFTPEMIVFWVHKRLSAQNLLKLN